MRIGRIGRIGVIATGMGLAALARWAPTHGEQIAGWVRESFGNAPADAFAKVRTAPIGFDSLLGILPMVLAGLVLALGIGRPPSNPLVVDPRSDSPPAAGRWLLGARGGLIAAVLATGWLASRLPSGRDDRLFWLWAGAILAGALGCWCLDRARGSRFGNPFASRREAALLVVLVAVELLYLAHDLAHWRWAGTPDEAYFFTTAREMARGTNRRFVFSEAGVFGYHPVLSSWYQAVFLRIFGENGFAWRLSSAAALAAALPFVYLLVRESCGRRAAWAATLLFGSAPLAVGFAHYGYNNAQLFAPVCAALGLYAWADRRRSVCGHFLTGVAAGLGFYTYFTARLVLPFLLFLVWGRGGIRRLWTDRAALVALLLGLAITLLPFFFELPRTLPQMLRLTGATGNRVVPISALDDVWPEVLSAERLWRFGSRWTLTVFHGVFSEESHHQNRPLADPVTVPAMTAGLFCGLFALLRRRREPFMPIFVSGSLVLAVAPNAFPALTRLLLLVPFAAILAAATLDALVRRLEGWGWRRTANGVTAMLVIVGVSWNVAALQYNIRNNWHGYAEGIHTEIIRRVGGWPARTRVLYILKPGSYLTFNPSGVFAAYGLEERISIVPEVTEAAVSALSPPFAVIHHGFDAAESERIEQAIAARFPAAAWRDSDPKYRWSIRYLLAAGGF